MSKPRLSPRMNASTQVDWCVAGRATHVVSSLANVSAGGALVVTCLPAPVGTAIEMRLRTEMGTVAATARVAWRTSDGMGVRFHA